MSSSTALHQSMPYLTFTFSYLYFKQLRTFSYPRFKYANIEQPHTEISLFEKQQKREQENV